MNTKFRKSLPGHSLNYFDAQAAVDAIMPGVYAKLPYTSKVLAEQLIRRCEPAAVNAEAPSLGDASAASALVRASFHSLGW